MTVLVLTLSSVSHRAQLCRAAEVRLCKAVWEPRAATSNSSCEPVCDLELGNLTAKCSVLQHCCLWIQLLSPDLTPHSFNNVLDKRIEQLWKKVMRQPQTKYKIHHLGHWKVDLRGKFFIPQVSDPVWDPHTNFQGQRMHLSQKARISPIKELQKKALSASILELGDSSLKGEFNDQCANQLKWENVPLQAHLEKYLGRWEAQCSKQSSVYKIQLQPWSWHLKDTRMTSCQQPPNHLVLSPNILGYLVKCRVFNVWNKCYQVLEVQTKMLHLEVLLEKEELFSQNSLA